MDTSEERERRRRAIARGWSEPERRRRRAIAVLRQSMLGGIVQRPHASPAARLPLPGLPDREELELASALD